MSLFLCAVDRTFSRPFCPSLRFGSVRVHMLRRRLRQFDGFRVVSRRGGENCHEHIQGTPRFAFPFSHITFCFDSYNHCDRTALHISGARLGRCSSSACLARCVTQLSPWPHLANVFVVNTQESGQKKKKKTTGTDASASVYVRPSQAQPQPELLEFRLELHGVGSRCHWHTQDKHVFLSSFRGVFQL